MGEWVGYYKSKAHVFYCIRNNLNKEFTLFNILFYHNRDP